MKIETCWRVDDHFGKYYKDREKALRLSPVEDDGTVKEPYPVKVLVTDEGSFILREIIVNDHTQHIGVNDD